MASSQTAVVPRQTQPEGNGAAAAAAASQPSSGQGPSAGAKRRNESEPDAASANPAKRPHRVATTHCTVLRMLVPSKKAAAIIGRQGGNISAVKQRTGAQVRVLEGLPGTDDRVVVISSKDADGDANPAQSALLEVFRLAYEGDTGNPASETGPLSIRMLVQYSQAGNIIGKQGSTIKETKEASGALVKVLGIEELPLCALNNDRLVVFSGTFDAIRKALTIVSQQLRDRPPKERPGGPTPAFLLQYRPPPQPPSHAPPPYHAPAPPTAPAHPPPAAPAPYGAPPPAGPPAYPSQPSPAPPAGPPPPYYTPPPQYPHAPPHAPPHAQPHAPPHAQLHAQPHAPPQALPQQPPQPLAPQGLPPPAAGYYQPQQPPTLPPGAAPSPSPYLPHQHQPYPNPQLGMPPQAPVPTPSHLVHGY